MNKNSWRALAAILLVVTGTMVYMMYTNQGFTIIPPPPVVAGESAFKVTGVAEDASTSVASATMRSWYDRNGDAKMQYSELGTFTEASGVYSSDKEDFPIGAAYDIWIQGYATNYQVTYSLVHMTGTRNSDGSAKSVGQMEFRATDDSLTYAGLINNIAWDDASDYNATLSGLTGTAKVVMELSAADKGISSQCWEQVDYMSIYGLTKPLPYFVKWDQISAGAGDSIIIGDSAVLAPDFFGIYMSIQDKIDLAPTVSDFDFASDDNTNWYGLAVVSTAWGDLMYNSADSPAPRPEFSFNVGTITAAGTTVATYGVAIHTGLTYEQMVSFKWTASATYVLGTGGNDWDFVI